MHINEMCIRDRYINTFKYTPKDVSCQLCTEYVKKLGCTAPVSYTHLMPTAPQSMP